MKKELAIRGRLKNKIAFLVSPSEATLEKFASSYRTGTGFKNIYTITELEQLKGTVRHELLTRNLGQFVK